MTRHVGLRLEAEEYSRFEKRAEGLGLSIQAAGRAAILDWIGKGGPQMSAEERETLDGVLWFMRECPEESMNVWLRWVRKEARKAR